MMSALVALLDLALPQECAGCERTSTRWCRSCDAVLRSAAARPLGLCAPDPRPVGYPLAAAAAPYDGPVRSALLAHKESGRLGLVGPLGAALAAAVQALGVRLPAGATLTLVPAPSRRAAVRARGHDHALRLARSGARVLRAGGRPAIAASELRPARDLADQAGLDSSQRVANLSGALQARRRLDGLHVVVVDDVVTTGATLAEAARALTASGAHVHGAATVAATARRVGGSTVAATARRGGTRSGASPVQVPIRGLPSEEG